MWHWLVCHLDGPQDTLLLCAGADHDSTVLSAAVGLEGFFSETSGTEGINQPHNFSPCEYWGRYEGTSARHRGACSGLSTPCMSMQDIAVVVQEWGGQTLIAKEQR